MKMTLVTPEEKRDYNNQYYADHKEQVQKQRRSRVNNTIRGRMSRLLSNCTLRSKRNNWECDLDLDFLCGLWDEQNGRCSLTGEVMSLRSTTNRWNSSLVSVDRIDNDLGYTKDNVWLVTTKANFAKGTQSLEDFISMCSKVMETLE